MNSAQARGNETHSFLKHSVVRVGLLVLNIKRVIAERLDENLENFRTKPTALSRIGTREVEQGRFMALHFGPLCNQRENRMASE